MFPISHTPPLTGRPSPCGSGPCCCPKGGGTLFPDGNGRIARLAMNVLLVQRGYLPVVIPPVLRHDYVAALEKAHEDDGSFLELMARSEIETQKDFLRLVRDAPRK